MNQCDWFIIEGATLVAMTPRKSMFLVRSKSFVANYTIADNDSEKMGPRRFVGNESSYVICSRQSPAMISGDDKSGWALSSLAPGAKDFIAGATERALIFYWATCHGMNVEDLDGAADLAVKLGYPNVVPESSLQDYPISRPMDAMKTD